MKTLAIVGVDGHASSDAAVDWAASWAAATASALRLTAVVETRWSGIPTPAMSDEYVAALEGALAEAKTRADGAATEVSLRYGEPVGELVEESRAGSVLVIGSSRTSVISGMVYGSVPLKLATETERPLVVVPAGWTPSAGPVVIGVDMATDHAALLFAASAASCFAVPLVLVHAWRTPELVIADLAQYATLTDSLKVTGADFLDEAEAVVVNAFPTITIASQLIEGDASLVLGRAAEAAQLVVVGSHRRHAFAGLLVGSVGHDLLMSMPCPVAIVPQQVSAS